MSSSARLPADFRARLEAAIRAAGGRIPFADFMSLALYDPKHGYYASGRARIGKSGDFYTNVSVGPIFGGLIAEFAASLWKAAGQPRPFQFIEHAAFDGTLASDILAWISIRSPELASHLEYHIVEPFETLRRCQEAALVEEAVTWHSQPPQLDGFVCHFANELIDALPVHLLRKEPHGWAEWGVGIESGALAGTWMAPSSGIVAQTAHSWLPDAELGTHCEVRPAATQWLGELAGHFILLCDYGLPRSRFLQRCHQKGTIRCYRNHRHVDDPFSAPGETDLTSSVDWTSLAESAHSFGWPLIAFADQCHFLTANAEGWLRSLDGAPPSRETLKHLRGFRSLTHPETMGRSFQFLALSRSIDPATLAAFRVRDDASDLLPG